jgi:hypothetical protein
MNRECTRIDANKGKPESQMQDHTENWMIRRLHRFRCQVDRYQGVNDTCATGAVPIGRRLDVAQKRNLRNLRIIHSGVLCGETAGLTRVHSWSFSYLSLSRQCEAAADTSAVEVCSL